MIDGVSSLNGTQHTIIPDRIVAATLMSAAAVTQSKITLKGIVQSHLGTVIPVLEEAGCKIRSSGGNLTISAPQNFRLSELFVQCRIPVFLPMLKHLLWQLQA